MSTGNVGTLRYSDGLEHKILNRVSVDMPENKRIETYELESDLGYYQLTMTFTTKGNNMKIIELLPIKEWEEKEGDKPTGDIRIYIGVLHVGTCRRKNKNEELYSFSPFYPIGALTGFPTYRTIDDIKIDLECCWKEFAIKFIKSLCTLVPASDLKTANPNKRFTSPLKKDGNGKR